MAGDRFVTLLFLPLLLFLPITAYAEDRPTTLSQFAVWADIQNTKTELAGLINDYRIDNGLEPWDYDESIETVALKHSQDMLERNYQNHTTLGTNIGPDDRGVNAGFELCGDSEAVELYQRTEREEEKFWEMYERYNDASSPTFVQYTNLEEQRIKTESLIEQRNQILEQEMIWIGFAENIMRLQQLNPEATGFQIADLTLQGWIDSPGHHALLLGYGELIGIGVTQDDNEMFIVLNVC